EVLRWFEGILISGDVGVTKPSPRIYHAFLDRFAVRADDCAFVDDRPENVEAARALGFPAVLFESAEGLRSDLRRLGLPTGGAAPRR
ncbi:MAG TPA: HAD-IA family hydrolase, partial [Actinomycetota bacterium]